METIYFSAQRGSRHRASLQATEAVRHTAGARQHGWAAYLEERERIPVAARTLSPLGSRFLGQVRENGLGL
jgi:hypothetical protein